MSEAVEESVKEMINPIFKVIGITIAFMVGIYIISKFFPQQVEVTPEEVKEAVVESIKVALG